MTANKFLLKLRDAIFMLNSGDIPLFINGSQVGDVKCAVEGEGAGIHISMTVKNENIKNGDKFLCINTVVMNDTGETTYIKDKEYVSEFEGCITNEQGIKTHYWSEEEGIWDNFIKLN